jgi:hypothetical protein
MFGFPFRSRASRVVPAILALGILAACGESTASGELAGTYTATKFLVTPTGQSTIDVLAQGGTMSITFGSNSTVSGTLFVPGSVTGGAPMSESMAGTFVRTGDTVEFEQTADTFVRDLTWTVGSTTLEVANQSAGGASFAITLTRQ